MSSLKLGSILKYTTIKNQLKLSSVRWYCKEEKKDEKPVLNKNETEKNTTSEQVLNKLNTLLKEIALNPGKEKNPIELAKPAPKYVKKSKEEAQKSEKAVTSETIVKSVKDVAETLGGDVKTTEAELMKKFLSTEENETVSNLSDIFKGMKIDRTQQQSTEQHSRSEQVKTILAMVQKQGSRRSGSGIERKPRRQAEMTRKPAIVKLDNIDLFGAEPLGIFDLKESSENVDISTKTWDRLKEHEMKMAVTHPPSNYFQQMILWTEQGKFWKFPIDNEQGLEDEQNVCFTEHIFLEKHLESWCPQKGPIRHFMELVCVGLSKNPYISADTKKEHIEWYRDYFTSKRDILKETGAGNLKLT